MDVELHDPSVGQSAGNHPASIVSSELSIYGDFSTGLELTNVFQLKVEKAKHHLGNLKKSVHRNENRSRKYHDIVSSEPRDLCVIPQKTPVDSLSESVLINRYVNPGQPVLVSDMLRDGWVLISQLEADRSSTEQQIEKQRAKVADLMGKISSIACFRMEMLPSAVQREHEACSNDILELHWHTKHRAQIEKKLRQKTNKAAQIHADLREEIDCITEQIPLMREKLELEEGMMKKIQESKEELLEESRISAEREAVTKEKHDAADRKIDTERKHIKRDLEKANKVLCSVQKSLVHNEKEYQKLLAFQATNQEKLRKNEAQILSLIKENETKSGELTSYTETLDKLERSERLLQMENRHLMETRNDLMSQYADQSASQDASRAAILIAKEDIDQTLVSTKRANRELEQYIEELRKSSRKCELDTEKMRARIEATREDIREADRRLEEALEEFSHTSKQHIWARDKFVKETQQLQEVESQLHNTVTGIEHSIKQEAAMKADFKIKLVTASQDLDNSKKDGLEKRNQILKSYTEVSATTREVQLKVSDLETQHAASTGGLRQLQMDLASLEANKLDTETRQNTLLAALEPAHSDLEHRLDELTRQEEHAQWRIQTMNSQLGDVAHSAALMTKSKKKTQESLLELDKNSTSLGLDLDMCRKYAQKTEDSTAQMVSQSNRLRATHETYLRQRQQVLNRLEKELAEALDENKSLAARYRASQTDLFSMQDSFLDVMQEQLWGQENVKNIKEVQRLQKYMHNNLELFFSLKLMFDNDRFHNLQQESGRNEEDVKRLRDQYSVYIERMRSFLWHNFSMNRQVLNDGE